MQENSNSHITDNLSGLFRSQFKDFEQTPSPATWNQINRKLWIMRFIRFGFTRFNLYYVMMILLAGSIIIASLEPESISPTYKIRTEHPDISKLDGSFTVTEDILNKSIDPAEEEPQDNRNTAKEDSAKRTDHLTSASLTPSKIIGEVNHQFTIQALKNDREPLRKKQSNPSCKIGNQNIDLLTDPTDIGQPDPGNNGSEKSAKLNEDSQPMEIAGQIPMPILPDPSDHQDSLASDLNIISDLQNPEENPFISNFIVYDTIRIFDTIPVYDTIKTKNSPNIISSGKGPWYFDLKAGINQTSMIYNHDDHNFRSELNNATSFGTGYLMGAQIGYSGRKLFAESGFNYQRNTELFTYTAANSLNENEFWIYQFNGYTHQTDTVSWQFIYNPEDTSYILIPVIVDSVFPNIDSTLVGFPKTEYRNQYSYITIPFITGYNFYSDQHLQIGIKAGIQAGIFLNAKGKTLSVVSQNTLTGLEHTSIPFVKVLWSWQVGLGITYRINDHFMLLVDPVYRRTTGSIFSKSYPVQAVKEEFTLQAGLRYLIPVKD